MAAYKLELFPSEELVKTFDSENKAIEALKALKKENKLARVLTNNKDLGWIVIRTNSNLPSGV